MHTKTKEEAIQDLRELFPRGSTVYTVFRRRSPSNMSAWYSVVCITPSGALHPNYLAAVAIGRTMVEKNGYFCIRMGGCGYDRPGTLVRDIARAAYGDERALRHEAL